jgi:ferrous iron transport protein B
MSQVVVSIIVITLFIPCISDIMAMVKELKLKKAAVMVISITLTAFLIGGVINYILQLTGYGEF